MMQSRSIAGVSPVATVGPRLVLVALVFNMVLCLITTRGGIHMSNTVVIVAELSILAVGLFAIRHRISAQAAQVTGVMCVFLTGMKLINPGLDLKIIHDIGIMYIFYELGLMSTLEVGNRLVWWAMTIVIVMGLFELLLPNVFVSFFDEWTYYVDKGVISASTVNYSDTGFFISGQRAGTLSRTFLPSLLGPHRVASVFLEPVSMGNFSVLIFAWCISTRIDRPRVKALLYVLAAMCFVLGDSRFASGCWLIMILFRCTPFYRSSFIVFCLPVMAVVGLVMCGSIRELPGVLPSIMHDDFTGRLVFSGRLLNYWTPSQWLGLAPSQVYTADTGYAYVINNLSLPLATFLLMIFAFHKVRTPEAVSMKAMISVYMATSLCIGANMFTIKTAALVWFLYGTANAARRFEFPSANLQPETIRRSPRPVFASALRSNAREW